jgi:hypothetical protein
MPYHRSKIESMAEELRGAVDFQRICHYFPVELHTDQSKLSIQVTLLDKEGRIVDVLTLESNPEGLIHPGTALYWLVVAFQMGLINETWRQAGKRVRKSEFK